MGAQHNQCYTAGLVNSMLTAHAIDEPLLVDSVRRQPTELNVWMVNRILNTNLEPAHRHLLLDLMQAVPRHAKVPARVADLARGFLRHQRTREAN